ncbi:MAG: protein phosphatase 2C domain-containing protein [Anaerolineales bacterium]|nr:protein phosphatase 2C domain-containing protein [Anaerolineales bacterium]
MSRFVRIFQKLLEKSSPTSPAILDEEPKSPASGQPGALTEIPQMVAWTAQSVGMQREHNEDAVFTLASTLSCNNRVTPVGLFIVADGMGGHQHGEAASGIAVRVIARQVLNRLVAPWLDSSTSAPLASFQEIMKESVVNAHLAILKQVPGSGTTVTAVLVVGKQMTIAHVGDSRAYAISASGETRVLTRDHSLAKRLVELGQLTSAEAAVHPQRNVLYRALGQGEPFEPDVNTTQRPDTGWLLVCSDGLWGVVPEGQIRSILTSHSDPQQACQALVESANRLGGPDNISVVLVQLNQA